MWIFLPLLVALAGGTLVFFAPRLLSTDAARSFLLKVANERINGTLSIRTWSFAWRQGIRFSGVRFVTGDDAFCFEAGGLAAEFPLLDMARAGYAIRSVAKGRKVSAPLEGELSIFHGFVTAGTGSDSSPLVTNLNAKAKLEHLDAPCLFALSADSVPAGGNISGTGSVHLLREGLLDLNAIRGNVSLKVSKWDLAPLIGHLFAMKGVEPPGISGVLGGAMKIDMDGLEDASAEAELALWPSLGFKSNAAAQPGFDTIDLSFAVKRDGNSVEIERLALSSDFFKAAASGGLGLSDSNTLVSADVSFTGKADPAEAARVFLILVPAGIPPNIFKKGASSLELNGALSMSGATSGNILDALNAQATGSISGLQLGPLALMAPPDPRRPDIAGLAAIRIEASVEGAAMMRARGSVEARGISASGGFLAGDSPSLERLNLDFDLEHKGGAIVINALDLRSSLLEAAASGTVRPAAESRIPDADISINGRLFAAEAARLFPGVLKLRRGVSISGGLIELRASAAARAERARFEAELKASKLTALMNGRSVRLDRDLSASLRGWAGANTFEIESLDVNSSFLTAQASGNETGTHASLQLNLAAALNEAAKFMDLEGKSASGGLAIDATIRLPGSRTASLAGLMSASNLMVSGFTPGPIRLNRARIEVEGVADVGRQGGIESVPAFSIDVDSDVAVIRAIGKNIVPGAVPSAGLLDIRAESDLSRALPFAGAFVSLPDDLAVTGETVISARCAVAKGVLNVGQLDARCVPFSLRQGDKLTVGKAVRASGRVSLPLNASSGDRLGRASADSSLFVGSARFLGIRIADLEAPLRLNNGCMELDLQTSINEGTLLLPLRLHLGRKPSILEIPNGTQALKNVRLTDEMVNETLAFVSPLLRGCAVSTGTLSAMIDRCKLPLGAAGSGGAAFKSTASFHDISLAPAGLLSDILSLVELENEKVIMPDQDVVTELRDGRFHSSDMLLRAGGHDIVISGSVGLDETLDYRARLPVTRKLIGKEAYEILKGKSIVLPVAGTVRRPFFDKSRFLKELTSSAVDAGARKLIERGADEGGELLEKGVEELRNWLGR